MSDLEGRRVLVTGGAGFLGSHLVESALARGADRVAILDALTYAAVPATREALLADTRCVLHEGDVADPRDCRAALEAERPDWVFHLAAETHVDRSLDDPEPFLRTNVVGTGVLLDAVLRHWRERGEPEDFRFVHSSTDEVFGALGPEGHFDEDSPYAPRSPYAASKAAADHLVLTWHESYGLPAILTHSGNNYGPRQFPEKLLPLMTLNALEGRKLPLYGDGRHVRDWIHVSDHAAALLGVARGGRVGARYCVSAEEECSNRSLVERVCAAVDALLPQGAPAFARVRHVTDRPGHDFRYAMRAARLRAEVGWIAQQSLASALAPTVRWYAENAGWVASAQEHAGYHRERLGLRGTRDGEEADA